MTREKARREIDSLDFYLQNHTDDYSEESHTAMVMAIKALEQGPILDKIIDEIMDTGAYEQEVNGETEFLKGINYCLEIIDKYKAEMESKE